MTGQFPAQTPGQIRWPLLFIVPVVLLGYQLMASSKHDFKLSWQWNRPITHAVLIRISDIRAEGRGLFGIKTSPSIAGSLPDAQELTGSVLASAEIPAGTHVVLRVPKHELSGINTHADAVIGYTDERTAIRIESVPAEISPDQHLAWLNQWLTKVRATP